MESFEMSYPKRCDKCGNLIFLEEINGKWFAYEDEILSTYHKCIYSSKTESSLDKILFLEKNLRRLNDIVQLQSERLRELESRK